jgi:LysR family transcriptional regulator, hydrogen peroxide-inducible genes activator
VKGREEIMEMHEVRYFLALCEERNFSRAAKRCGVAQPSLTKAIKRLESKLGGDLFYRGQSETRMTRLGKLVKPRLQRIHQEAANATQVARKYMSRESHVILPTINSIEV